VREKGVWAGQQVGIYKVKLGLGEIEGRDRDTERYRDTETKRQRYREIQRHRNKETELTIKIPSKAG
jgi:hypothetical protein